MSSRALTIAVCCTATSAGATGFTDLDSPPATGATRVELDGSLRVRTEALDNLDLDRGTTPSGLSIFPVPLNDPSAQVLTGADLRLRTDASIITAGGGFSVKLRADLLDNVVLGSTRTGGGLVHLRRAYGEAYTPFGVVAAGRMGNQWGLGMLANGGDCADCDSGDSADRLAFITPLVGHIFALAYDFSSSDPIRPRADGARSLVLDPTVAARTLTFGVLRWRSERSTARRTAGGRTTVDYGAYVSHRTQDFDLPSTYLPAATPTPISPTQIIARGLSATAIDAWVRFIHPVVHLEAEVAVLVANVAEASLVPGVSLRGGASSLQIGGALESDVALHKDLSIGLDAGIASGDSAPGFGAFPGTGAPSPAPGELDGPQAKWPGDRTVDNFRFHPDYRIDRILFREIIGTVTDAVYVRPHVRWTLVRTGPGSLVASVAGIASFAMFPESTPGGSSPLGIEIDPSIAWRHADGFSLTLDYAVLFPLSGFDNPARGLTAQPAQLLRLRLQYGF